MTAGLKVGVESTAKRKAVQVYSIEIAQGAEHATVLPRHATVIQVGRDEVVRNPPVLVLQCARLVENAKHLATILSALVKRAGWVELARLNASMEHHRKQLMVHFFASVMVATVV